MPKNLEVKIPVTDLHDWKNKLHSLGAEFVQEVQQTDTYFIVARGRLKLREASESESELIYYQRDERASARWSEYQVVRVSRSAEIKALLSEAFGVRAVVEKQRQIYLYKGARIHLDQVTGLGEYLELEVVESDGRGGAHQILDFLLEKLSLQDIEKLKVSYSDLILRPGRAGR